MNSNNPIDRARAYLAKLPPAISGQGGHAATYTAAVAVAHGFNLPEPDALNLLMEYNARCQPPWSERELEHKLRDAVTKPHAKPRGHLLGTNGHTSRPPVLKPAPKPTLKPVAPIHDLTGSALPDPIPDGARTLIRHLFQAGEGIRLVNAKLNDDGREVPDGNGPVLSREEWLLKLDAHDGNPNGIFKSSKKTGIYIALNPLKIGATTDAAVTDFRHALVEFDEGLSPAEQFGLYEKMRIPCAAVIFSGGKSVHAWVKIGAATRQEYDGRVRILYDHFAAADYSLDTKNKNPSRLSRLPNCERFAQRQELLAIDQGAESFTAWQAEAVTDGIGKTISVLDLENYDTEKDVNTILGNRWLCKGGSCLLIGPSGVGKSSLAVQLAAAWATGLPAFGIQPARALRVLIVQAENDIGDLAEMVNGVRRGLGIQPFTNDEASALLNKNLVFVTDSTHTGRAFADSIHRLIDRHKPDLVVFDPLLSFIGDDVSKQSVCSQFLREWLNPISEATGVAWLCVHHTGKPSTDPKSKSHWKSSDYSYSGIGSSELTNWTRATMVLEQAAAGTFRLMLSKRGKRAGATHTAPSGPGEAPEWDPGSKPQGEPTTTVWLRHSEASIYWEQIQPPEEPSSGDQSEPKPKRQTIPETIRGMNLAGFLSGCTEDGESLRGMTQRLRDWLVSKGSPKKLIVSKGTGESAIGLLLESGKIESRDGRYFRGSNA